MMCDAEVQWFDKGPTWGSLLKVSRCSQDVLSLRQEAATVGRPRGRSVTQLPLMQP